MLFHKNIVGIFYFKGKGHVGVIQGHPSFFYNLLKAVNDASIYVVWPLENFSVTHTMPLKYTKLNNMHI